MRSHSFSFPAAKLLGPYLLLLYNSFHKTKRAIIPPFRYNKIYCGLNLYYYFFALFSKDLFSCPWKPKRNEKECMLFSPIRVAIKLYSMLDDISKIWRLFNSSNICTYTYIAHFYFSQRIYVIKKHSSMPEGLKYSYIVKSLYYGYW